MPYSIGGGAIWVSVNHAMDDGGVLAMAQRLRASMPRFTKLYVEYSNEILIPNAQYLWLNGAHQSDEARAPRAPRGGDEANGRDTPDLRERLGH